MNLRLALTAKRELERKVEEAAARPEWAPVVDALCLVKGIDVATAFLLLTLI